MIAFRQPAIYLAARSEDQDTAIELRAALAMRSIACTARWLDLDDLSQINALEAELCLTDIIAADALLLYSRRETFRNTTGGHHVETGAAIILGKPIVIFGEPQNVFHGLRSVRIVPREASLDTLAETLRNVVSARVAGLDWDRPRRV